MTVNGCLTLAPCLYLPGTGAACHWHVLPGGIGVLLLHHTNPGAFLQWQSGLSGPLAQPLAHNHRVGAVPLAQYR